MLILRIIGADNSVSWVQVNSVTHVVARKQLQFTTNHGEKIILSLERTEDVPSAIISITLYINDVVKDSWRVE